MSRFPPETASGPQEPLSCFSNIWGFFINWGAILNQKRAQKPEGTKLTWPVPSLAKKDSSQDLSEEALSFSEVSACPLAEFFQSKLQNGANNFCAQSPLVKPWDFSVKKSQTTKNLHILRRCRGQPRFCPTYKRGVENTDFSFSKKCVFYMFSKDLAILCPKPAGRPAVAGPAGLGHKIFWKDLPKNHGTEFFPKVF